MADPGPFVADLRAESDDLDALVAHLPADRWADPTPAPGWTIAHQIGHLLWTDRVALTAVTDEAGFAELMTAAAANPAGFVDDAATELAAVSPAELLTDWRVTRGRLHEERLGDRQPALCVLPYCVDVKSAQRAALGDQEAEVLGGPGDPLGRIGWPPRPSVAARSPQLDQERLGRRG